MRAVAVSHSHTPGWFHVYLACDGWGGGFNKHREYVVPVHMPDDGEPPSVGAARPAHIQASNGSFSWVLNPFTLVNQAKRALSRRSSAGALARVLACDALGLSPELLVGPLRGYPCPFCGKLPVFKDV